MTGQLLARAIVEGRASLDDEVDEISRRARIPNLANGGENIRLVHLANMTSQLVDNIPDLTQVRTVPGEPLAATRMRRDRELHAEEFLRQLHRVAPRRAPGMRARRIRTSRACCSAWCCEKIYGEPFESILAREIEKPLRMGSGTQPDAKLLAKGYTQGQRGTAGLHGADGIRVRIAALQHR